jgi:hypothetical protein
MTIRMFATAAAGQFDNNNGLVCAPAAPAPTQRAYSATVGVAIDIPGDLAGDAALLANAGFIALGSSGATSARPTNNLKAGQWHIDTTLGFAVFYDGTVWRNPISGASV